MSLAIDTHACKKFGYLNGRCRNFNCVKLVCKMNLHCNVVNYDVLLMLCRYHKIREHTILNLFVRSLTIQTIFISETRRAGLWFPILPGNDLFKQSHSHHEL